MKTQKNLFTVHFSFLKYQDASLRHDSCTEDKRSVDAFFHTALLPLFDTCGDTGTEVLLQVKAWETQRLQRNFLMQRFNTVDERESGDYFPMGPLSSLVLPPN